MKFTSTIALSAIFSLATATGWNSSVETTEVRWVTQTGYTTFCPAETTLTVTTCSENVCGPNVITVTEASTVTITDDCLVATKPPIVTDYVVVCPEETTITITTCEAHVCGPKTVTVYEPGTVTISGECVVPTEGQTSAHPTGTVTPHSTAHPTGTVTPQSVAHPTYPIDNTIVTVGKTTVLEYVTYCPEPTTLTVTTCESNVCGDHVVEVLTPGTITVSESCVVETTKTTVADVSTHQTSYTKSDQTTESGPTTIAGESTPAPSVVYEGAASNKAAGAFVFAVMGLLMV